MFKEGDLKMVEVIEVGTGKHRTLGILKEEPLVVKVSDRYGGSRDIYPNEGVTRVSALLFSKTGERGRVIRLVGKEPLHFYGNDRFFDAPTEEFAYHWGALRNAGLPVVPHLFIAGAKKIYMTDLIALGGTIYDKFYHSQMPNLAPSPEDSFFLNLDFDELKGEAQRISALAADARIALALDDPFALFVRPNGMRFVYNLDIGMSRLNVKSPSKKLLASNNALIDVFMLWMEQIRECKLSLKEDLTGVSLAS